jgi:hypothetical protein
MSRASEALLGIEAASGTAMAMIPRPRIANVGARPRVTRLTAPARAIAAPRAAMSQGVASIGRPSSGRESTASNFSRLRWSWPMKGPTKLSIVGKVATAAGIVGNVEATNALNAGWLSFSCSASAGTTFLTNSLRPRAIRS